MDAAHVGHHRAADHYVVEVGDDEVRVMKVHVHRERGEEDPGQAADREERKETQGVEKRCSEDDRPADRACRSN